MRFSHCTDTTYSVVSPEDRLEAVQKSLLFIIYFQTFRENRFWKPLDIFLWGFLLLFWFRTWGFSVPSLNRNLPFSSDLSLHLLARVYNGWSLIRGDVR